MCVVACIKYDKYSPEIITALLINCITIQNKKFKTYIIHVIPDKYYFINIK